MTDVVTSSTAISQANLFAPRQQVFVVERTASASDDAASSEFAKASQHSNAATSPRRDDVPAPSPTGNDGPSRARVELPPLDLTSSDNAGTADDDSAGDAAAAPADDAGQEGAASTFAGVSENASQPAAGNTPAAANADTGAAAPDDQATGEAKKFSVSLTPDGHPVAQKFADSAAAASGVQTATVDVPKKFYGQGVEAIVGAVVNHAAPQGQSLHEKAAASKQSVSQEHGTGETKLYDKVAQAEAQQHHAGQRGGQEPSLHEKARQVALATSGSKKTVVVEVATYNTTAALASATTQAGFLVESTDLTA